MSDPVFAPCSGGGRFRDSGRYPAGDPTAAPTRTIALSMRASSATAAIPRDGRAGGGGGTGFARSEEHTSELQSQSNLVCRLLLEKKTYPPLRTTLWTRSTSRALAIDTL